MHFPDSDPRYQGIASRVLLERTLNIVVSRGFAVGNVDVSVVAQRPKLQEALPAMKKSIAGILQVEADAVNIKATTTEGLGFEGREEGIAAFAVACLVKTVQSS
jgi:2-C-methyl-D-erythritol 2,4-cyclodiphosphate synthase